MLGDHLPTFVLAPQPRDLAGNFGTGEKWWDLGTEPAALSAVERPTATRLVLGVIRERSIRIEDGSQQSRVVGGSLIAAYALATVLLLVSHLEFGPQDLYLPGGLLGGQINALAAMLALGLCGVFLAAATWNAMELKHHGASSHVPRLIPIGVTIVNVVLGLSLISTAATVRTMAGLFENMPSIVVVDTAVGDLSRVIGIAALVSCVVLLALYALAPQRRLLIALTAGLPAVMCAAAYAVADRGVLDLNASIEQSLLSLVPPETVQYITAPASARILNGPMLILSLGSTAFLFLLVAFGVGEFVDAKSKIAELVVGARRITSSVVVAVLGGVAAVFIAGRLGWLPDGDKAVNAFKESAPEAWIVAALMAWGGLVVIRSAHRHPLERRSPRTVVALACVALVAGQIALFLSDLARQFADTVVDPTSWGGRLFFERLPKWSLWFDTWTTLIATVALGLWAVQRYKRGERSPRTVFAAAFAVVVFPLQLTKVLDQHDAAKGIWGYHNATPDLIAVSAIAIVAVLLVLRQPLFDDRTTLVVVLVAFLVTLLDVAVPVDFTFGTFQMLLVAPFVYRFLFNSVDLRAETNRGAITMAGIGLLFVASAVSVAVGQLTGESFEFGEQFAFIQLAAPLALVVLCPTALGFPPPLGAPSTSSKWSNRQRRALRLGATGVAVASVVGILALSISHLPDKPDRGPYQVDVRVIPDSLVATQVRLDSNAEAVELTDGATIDIQILHIKSADALDLNPCAEENLLEGFGISAVEPLHEVDPVAGLPAVSGPVSLGGGAPATMTCAHSSEGDVSRTFVVFEEPTELSPAARAVAQNVVFREE